MLKASGVSQIMMCDDFYRRWRTLKKGLRGNGEYTKREDLSAGKLIRRRGIDSQLLLTIIQDHITTRDATPDRLVKQTKKRCVSRISHGESTFIVKEFFHPGPWGKFSADSRAWVNNWGLELCESPVPEVYGWLRAPTGRGYVVFEELVGKGSYSYLKSVLEFPDRFNCTLATIYSIIADLYRKRIIHEDLKLGNFIVNGDTVWLIDNDDVRFDVTIRDKHWQRTVKQLVGAGEGPVYSKLSEFISGMPRPF